jgi:transposase, IS6 family
VRSTWSRLSNRPAFGVRRAPVPAGGDHGRGPLVPGYSLSYRDMEELLAECGIEVDHVTVYWWVQRFTPLFADAARPLRHATGDRWFVDETYVKVAGRWRYLYRAVDQYGNNRVEADHGRLKARLRPMRGVKRFRSAARIAAGHAFVQNLRRGHYELATDISPQLRLAAAFDDLALAM